MKGLPRYSGNIKQFFDMINYKGGQTKMQLCQAFERYFLYDDVMNISFISLV